VAHARLVIEGAAASAPQVSRVARKLARQFGALAKRQQGEGRAAA
ncbi:MAG: hypothetical protein HY075_00840, partial [Deltaproteobacteria bacterium]|nr:hypothetical protein [Deltaproteobacteria bacterium]